MPPEGAERTRCPECAWTYGTHAPNCRIGKRQVGRTPAQVSAAARKGAAAGWKKHFRFDPDRAKGGRRRKRGGRPAGA